MAQRIEAHSKLSGMAFLCFKARKNFPKQVLTKMRIDSCRNCGNALSVIKYCKVCDQPIQFRCNKCYKFADDPVHTRCIRQKQPRSATTSVA